MRLLPGGAVRSPPGARPGPARDPHGFLGVPAEELSGVGHFRAGVGDGLAVLDADQTGEVLSTLGHQVKGPPEHPGPVAWRRAGPGRHGRSGYLDGSHRVFGGGARDGRDLVSRRRVENGEPRVVRRVPVLPAHKQVVRNCEVQCLLAGISITTRHGFQLRAGSGAWRVSPGYPGIQVEQPPARRARGRSATAMGVTGSLPARACPAQASPVWSPPVPGDAAAGA
jgi:hypothetical protein